MEHEDGGELSLVCVPGGMLGLSLPAEVAIAQQKNLAAQLVGTWSLVSNINVKKEGTIGAGYAELTWKRVT